MVATVWVDTDTSAMSATKETDDMMEPKLTPKMDGMMDIHKTISMVQLGQAVSELMEDMETMIYITIMQNLLILALILVSKDIVMMVIITQTIPMSQWETIIVQTNMLIVMLILTVVITTPTTIV